MVVIPNNTEVNESFLAQVERASLRGDQSRLQSVAQANGFLLRKVSERRVVLFPSEFATRATARAQKMIEWLSQEEPLLLNTLNPLQLKEAEAMLQRASERVRVSGIGLAIQGGNQIYLQRAATLYAEVKVPDATLRLELSKLEPFISLPTKENGHNSPQGSVPLPIANPAPEEGIPEWRVFVYGHFGSVSEQSELIAQAFGIISEATKRDEQNAKQVYEGWRHQLQVQHLNEQGLPAEWQEWTALPEEWKEKVYTALLGSHLNESEVLDASKLDSLIAEGRIEVRFRSVVWLQVLKVPPQGPARLILVPLDDEVGGVAIFDPYPPSGKVD